MEPGTHDASMRTYLAEERTLLAWWRSGLPALAVAVGVGRLLPALLDEDGQGPFVALDVAYAFLGLGLVLFGSLRERMQVKALAEGASPPFARARHRAHRVPGLARARHDRPRPVRLSAGSVRLRSERPDPMIGS